MCDRCTERRSLRFGQCWGATSMPTPTPKLATYEDLLGLPERIRGEVIAGELVTARSVA